MKIKVDEIFYLIKRNIYSFYFGMKLKKHGTDLRVEYSPIRLFGLENVEIGDHFRAGTCLRLEAIYKTNNGQTFSPAIVIGNNFDCGQFCHIGAINLVKIGNNVLMGSKVYITDHQHGNYEKEYLISPGERTLTSRGPVLIEDNVWIGDNVVIMDGVKIGKGSVVGANAVVTHDVPEYSVVVGAPAKVIKTINRLNQIDD